MIVRTCDNCVRNTWTGKTNTFHSQVRDENGSRKTKASSSFITIKHHITAEIYITGKSVSVIASFCHIIISICDCYAKLWIHSRNYTGLHTWEQSASVLGKKIIPRIFASKFVKTICLTPGPTQKVEHIQLMKFQLVSSPVSYACCSSCRNVEWNDCLSCDAFRYFLQIYAHDNCP